MKLYTFALSGHAHRAELFLALTGIPHTLVPVALREGEQQQASFLAKNVFGQVPVLEDGDVHIPDSNAILVYVALKHGLVDWYPTDPVGAAEVQRWLTVAAGLIAYGPAAARLVTVFGASLDADTVIARSHKMLATVETHLADRTWLASTDHPTIADVAFFSYVDRAPEGNVDLTNYPRVRGLLDQVRALPGFIAMPVTAAGLLAG